MEKKAGSMAVRVSMQLLLCLFLLLATVITSSADQTGGAVEVEGYASILNGRKDLAREAALQNAFRRAVEQVVGVAIESKTVVKDYELLNDKIFSRSRGFIKSYRILSEKSEGDSFRLSIFASVSRYKLEQSLDDVGLLIKKIGKPRIAVVLMEQNCEGPNAPGGLVETRLISDLGKKGYLLVDRQALLAVEHELARGSADQTDAVVRAAAAGGAEVVIIGQATARPAAALSGTNLRPVQVSISCRAFDVDTGTLLATAVVNQQALHVNPSTAGSEALQKAAVELTENLHRQMIAAWTKRLSGLRTLHMTIASLPFDEIRLIQDRLKEQLVQVEDVHDRGYRNQQLSLDLEVTGRFQEIIDELALLKLEHASLKITGYSAGQVQARWQGRPVKGGRTK